MTVLLIAASVFWALFFAYPWIDLALGNNGWLEHKVMDWLYDNVDPALFAPIDVGTMIEDMKRELNRR